MPGTIVHGPSGRDPAAEPMSELVSADLEEPHDAAPSDAGARRPCCRAITLK